MEGKRRGGQLGKRNLGIGASAAGSSSHLVSQELLMSLRRTESFIGIL